MYDYEIMTGKTHVKTNDLEHAIKVIKYLIDKDYRVLFRNKETFITIEDIFDLEMLKDNI